MRDGSEGSPVAVVGDKRKAGSDIDELSSEGGVREMRRTRARRIAQDEVIPRLSLTTATDREVMPRLSLTAAGGFIGTLDHVRPQESKTVGSPVPSGVSLGRANRRPSKGTARSKSKNMSRGMKGRKSRVGSHPWMFIPSPSKTDTRTTKITKETTKFALPSVP